MKNSISTITKPRRNGKKIATCLFITQIYGCGYQDDSTKTQTMNVAVSTKEIAFRGYISGAFPITVDGLPYEDSEDFYTKELDRIPQKLKAAGFDNSWTWKLDAILGFQDISLNMMVYISPTAKNGYLAQSNVDNIGAFEMSLPIKAQDDSYMVRSVKRINLVVEKQGFIKTICYNFSATDKNVPASDIAKPIVLTSFSTKITAYSCAQETSNGGLVIPKYKSTDTDDSENERSQKEIVEEQSLEDDKSNIPVDQKKPR